MPRGKKDEDYKYMQVADAIPAINQRVNLVGVVVDIKPSKPTRGTDFSCSVKIIGECMPNVGIFIVFFAETVESLPFVESVGDIILISRVSMKTRGSEVYAMYNKKFSSFALFEGRDYGEGEFLPYQSSPKFSARRQDRNLITGLRKWLIHGEHRGLNDVSSFMEIKKGERLNLLCKVLHVCKMKEDEFMFFLWDGTDTPPTCIEAKLEDEMDRLLPLQLEPSPLSRSILCTFPPVGSVLRMIIDQEIKKINVNSIIKNRWVKFVGIKCDIRAGLWYVMVLPSSKVYILSDDDNRIQERERPYNERIHSKFKRMPYTSFPWPSHISVTDYPDVPFVTLMNVLTHPEVTYKFHCVVRVIAVFPSRADDFRSPDGIYRVRLTLEDPTARIHAYLYADDGVQFFGNDFSTDILARRRNMLLGISEEQCQQNSEHVPRTPPWIECCLKSYYTDKSDPWGNRNYRIFGTTLNDC